MSTVLIFGAGNIGRAFIGQIFSKNGYEVVFADVQETIINLLNDRKSYTLAIRENDEEDEIINISNVRAVNVKNISDVVDEICDADILATSVGMNAIPHIAPVIAEGIQERINRQKRSIDLILAENIHNGKDFLLTELRKYISEEIEVERYLGIVQSSIGKMVPIVTEKDKENDPLLVASERYNELILDSDGFLNMIPNFPEVNAVHPIEAYIDRKLYIHNLGHAAAAYIGSHSYPSVELLAEVLECPDISQQVRAAMMESASALADKYPETFDSRSLKSHVNDLLCRFRNRSLGDTVFRVGRDLKRKLNREDRILGAIRNCEFYGVLWGNIGKVFMAARDFIPVNSNGKTQENDFEFIQKLKSNENNFISLCGLDINDPIDASIIYKLKNQMFS